MYFSHFGLDQAPFSITPNPAFFYTGNKRGAILEALIYAVTNGEGIIKVTGEVGSGKTMLCRMLESQLPQDIEVIYLVNPTLGREEVLYAIAGELGLATGGKRPDEVIRLLQSDLIAKHAAGKQVVLLVEEAQAMPLDTLEEIRLFSNLETAHHKLLQIVLFGQPELDESLKLPRMRQLKERITHSFDVPPLEPDVIPEYLMYRMRTAGYRGPDIFSKQAVKRIAAVSEGIVRRISILADKSLLAAFADNTHMIEEKHVKAAIADSEFAATLRTRRMRKIAAWSALLAGGLLTSAALAWHFSKPALVQQNLKPAAASIAKAGAPSETKPPADTAAVAAPAASAPAQPAASVASPPAASTVTQAVPAASALEQRLSSSKNWLQHEPPSHYTVQVALLDADERVLAEQAIQTWEARVGAGAVHLFPTRLGGEPRFGLVVGSHATRDEAVVARKRLTKKTSHHAKLRTVEGLRQEIDATKSADMWPK